MLNARLRHHGRRAVVLKTQLLSARARKDLHPSDTRTISYVMKLSLQIKSLTLAEKPTKTNKEF